MADAEKYEVSYYEGNLGEKAGVTEVKTIIGSEAFTEALVKDPPRPFAPRSLLLYFACLIGFFCSTVNGFDGSLLLSIQCSRAFSMDPTLAILGASQTDRVGRRPLLLFANFGCAFTWIGMTACSAVYNKNGSAAAARGTLAMIYIFLIIFSIGMALLQALYPVEALSFKQRVEGMAFSNLAVSAGDLLNQFVWPVSLKAIGWKTYIIFATCCFFQGITIYLLCPETKGRTLEELDEIFNSKNPRKASTQKKKIALDANTNVWTCRRSSEFSCLLAAANALPIL